MKNPSLQLPAKRTLCFAMPSYCLKSSILTPSDHQYANLYRCWHPRLASIGSKGATTLFTHLIVDGKNKEVIIETP
jgi:hypothetical protein